MNNRFLLYIAFSLVLFMIWQQWQIEQSPQQKNNISIEQNQSPDQHEKPLASGDLPDEAEIKENSKSLSIKKQKPQNRVSNSGENITLSNSDVKVSVNTIGGTINKVQLLNYLKYL